LGKKRRRVRLFACETLFPLKGRFPVTWHTLAIDLIPNLNVATESRTLYLKGLVDARFLGNFRR
jgi:hypothetical protein